MKNSSWACPLCKDAGKECFACKVKDKQIHNLKRNIADFERNTEHLNLRSVMNVSPNRASFK